MVRNCVRKLLAVGLLLAVADPALAINYMWTATSGGTFQTAGDWAPLNGPPGAGDMAVFSANASYTVTFTASASNASFFQSQGNVTFDIGAGRTYGIAGSNGTFTVGAGNGLTSSLTVISGTLNPTAINGSGATGGIGTSGGAIGNLTITGSGTAFNCGDYCSIGISGAGTLTVQNNATATIPHTPYLGAQSGGSGTVTVSTGGAFSAPNAIVVGNSGTGNFAINGGGSATVDAFNAGQNTGSTGTVSVGDGTSAAALTVTNNASYQVSIGIGLSGTGFLNVNSGGTLTGVGNVSFANAVGSSGTGTIGGTWNQTTGSMYIGGATTGAPGGDGSLTVNNGGALTLSGTGAGITTIAGHGTLTINAGGTVTTPAFTNHGTFNLAGGTLITGTMNGSGLLNDRTMTVGTAPADVYGPVNNTGAGQIINSSGGVLTFHDAVTHNGLAINTTAGGRTVFLGAVSGTGPYTGVGTVEYDGTVNPASSPALVTYAGDLALGSTAALDVVLGGTTAGSRYDQFAVTGAAMLDGALNVALVNGFTPQPGQQFAILTYGAHSGDFSSFSGLDLGNGYELMPTPGPNTYSLVVTPVPEPSATAPLGATAVIMLWRRRRSG